MTDFSTEQLLAQLHHQDEEVRAAATELFWQQWFQQKGIQGARQLMRGQALMQGGHLAAAATLLDELIHDQPDFAEAWNRRAVLHYATGDYDRAIADCQATLNLVPHHFGALHGLGLCHAALGDYSAAIQAFRQALAVQPYALVNQRLILECTAKL